MCVCVYVCVCVCVCLCVRVCVWVIKVSMRDFTPLPPLLLTMQENHTCKQINTRASKEVTHYNKETKKKRYAKADHMATRAQATAVLLHRSNYNPSPHIHTHTHTQTDWVAAASLQEAIICPVSPSFFFHFKASSLNMSSGTAWPWGLKVTLWEN